MAEHDGLLAGELRELVRREKLPWRVSDLLADDAPIPSYSLGGIVDEARPAREVGPIDFKVLFDVAPSNPFLVERAIERGVFVGGSERAAPASVDWRSRWGWPWITSVRNQYPCAACWAFAATALVEAMVRIEHCVFPHYSEGDLEGVCGKRCTDGGNPDFALQVVNEHGLCDPQCFAWSTANPPYTPSSDRDGRSVRGGDRIDLGVVADQKVWLDIVGPLTCWFEVYEDFQGYGSGVYSRLQHSQNNDRGSHVMLIVGYDDTLGAWLVKNSWGTNWGMGGYAWIDYGQTVIDEWAKVGVRNMNPDPWTKRRIHSGNMIESGNGSRHRNFEMVATIGGGGMLQHWWRDNDALPFPWSQAYAPFGGDAAFCPTLTASTFDRNFECVFPTIEGRLHHWFFDQASQAWTDGGVFGPSDVYSVPGFIQSNYTAPGNFEVVVAVRGRLTHWRRQNGPPWAWTEQASFGWDVQYSGPSLVQSHFGTPGNLDVVCVLDDGQMQHWSRENDSVPWLPQEVFGPLAPFRSSCSSGPCMIEGQYGALDENAAGYFELCVAIHDGTVQHWRRENQSQARWYHEATFGHDVQAVLALVEGSFGFNLEAIVLRADGMLQHYWRWSPGYWFEGAVIGSA
jgi:hypothetical protein